jgi:hypothetical protein
MAEIAGATITYTDYTATPADPRLLNVPDAVGDVTVQDILDTCSAQQAELDALIYDPLLDIPDTSGKQTLSATKQVGITCVLIRTRVKFEDLPGPSYTIKRVLDGNLAAIDGEVTRVQIEEMENSTFVNWKTEADVSAALISGSSATAVEIATEVWDETRGTTVVDSVALLRHQGAIHIDGSNGTSGTVIGVNGTPENPVLSLADAITLADATGLRHLILRSGSLLLTASLTEFLVESWDEGEIDFGGQNINGSEFRGGLLKGSMSGTVTVRSAVIEDVTGLLGQVLDTGIGGTIELAVGKTTFDACRSQEPGLGTPTLDYVGAGRTCVLRGYKGGLKIENFADATNVSTLGFMHGQLIIDGSCGPDGDLVVRGIVGPLTNNGSIVNLNLAGRIDPERIEDAAAAAEAAEDALIAARLTVAAGSTSSVVLTNALQATDFYNGMVVVARNVAGNVARRIASYSVTSGAFTLEPALPFTPLAGDDFIVLGALGEVSATGGSGGGLDADDAVKLCEVHRILGLDPEAPLCVSKSSQEAGTIRLTQTEVGTKIIVQRDDE